ncbi:MAG: hypothetical protein JNN12_14625 [Bacteroidetes Order II. Incertae sedis bacterium]|nr:hypothetical protein [Bacteroidetes Order II. bacterium]
MVWSLLRQKKHATDDDGIVSIRAKSNAGNVSLQKEGLTLKDIQTVAEKGCPDENAVCTITVVAIFKSSETESFKSPLLVENKNRKEAMEEAPTGVVELKDALGKE